MELTEIVSAGGINMVHQLGSPSDGFCPFDCGKGKPEGTHFKHDGHPCTWHDGTCEEANLDESLWCQCGRDELAHKLWIEAYPNGKPSLKLSPSLFLPMNLPC